MLVLPYLTAEFRNNKKSFENFYDEIEICESSSSSHYKSAIYKRNCHMADRADLCILYVSHPNGGAYKILKYVRNRLPHINLSAECT